MANARNPKHSYRVTVNGQAIAIYLGEGLYTNWQNQFHQKGGKNAVARALTLKNMIKAAYALGYEDGRAAPRP